MKKDCRQIPENGQGMERMMILKDEKMDAASTKNANAGVNPKSRRTNPSNPKRRVPLFAGALFCCALWGMAPALIKSGYAAMDIHSTGSILLFAGTRFFLAGLMVLAYASIQKKKLLLPKAKTWKPIIILACFQTFGQYMFYYLGAAKASGMMVSVLSGTSALLALIFSAWIFHLEKMTVLKMTGCILGFLGILTMNFNGACLSFTWGGEGMVLCSQVCSALSAVLIQIFSQKDSPILLSGWQFTVGGAAMIITSLCFGDYAIAWNGQGLLILLVLAFVSAGAYTIWGVLLSRWPVSSVGVYGCTIGLFGVLFSALFLHEQLSIQIAFGTLLMSGGILLVNMQPDVRAARAGKKW